ncbi:hypothetical protein CO229_00505 [Mycoplasmopsis bovirhinis]|uniref:hypothetical protein n=1 Tax=Mycoplasmopsis bovirhinis TaxID=29553 RepID=UPI000C05A4B9|nr:hypothetical protein [Mycoplasmopsis bovirhinis]ATO30611.1 hypothetical protein CO229_00505 [Mycoplasmopsis bovirhinis]
MRLKEQKTKIKRLFWLFSIPAPALATLSAVSCSNTTSKPYFSESKTDGGQRVVRFHYPNSAPDYENALWSSVFYDEIEKSVIFDDAFKNEHAEVIKQYKDAYNEYHKPITYYDKKDSDAKYAKLRDAQKEVIDKWQAKNIKINKSKIFSLINSQDDLSSDKYIEIKDIFKNIDFSKSSILVINGLNYVTNTSNSVVKGSGYWIKKIDITNNLINLQYKWVEIREKGSRSAAEDQVLSGTSTVHYIVIDKLSDIKKYDFTFTKT